MKKYIKYAGITAAVLLTISPIAGPVFSATTVVQADVTVPDSTEMQSIAKEMGDNLSGQELSYDFANNSSIQSDLDAGFKTATDNNITDGSILINKGINTETMNALGYSTPWTYAQRDQFQKISSSVYFTIKIYDPSGTQITNAKALDSAINSNETLKGYKVDIGLAYANNTSGTSFTELDAVKGLNIIDESEITSADITVSVPDVTVKQGSKVSDLDISGIKETITDDNGIQFGKAVVPGFDMDGYVYYKDLDGARSKMDPMTASTEDPDKSGVFSKPGTFYTIVHLHTSRLAEQFLEDYINQYPNAIPVFNVNGEPVNTDQRNQPDQNYKFGGVSSEDYVIQKVTVTPVSSGNSGSSSTNNSISGIVTTHSDKASYSIYNDDNKTVGNRALVKNSSWKVDGVRTLNGVKQYRVSTHEWVNASDVDFIEDGKVTEGMTVTKLDKPKEILLATTHNTYNLQNSKNEVSTTRALAGGTSWMVDKIGTDMHGGIYYGVSTDEFVKAGDGVDASL